MNRILNDKIIMMFDCIPWIHICAVVVIFPVVNLYLLCVGIYEKSKFKFIRDSRWKYMGIQVVSKSVPMRLGKIYRSLVSREVFSTPSHSTP